MKKKCDFCIYIFKMLNAKIYSKNWLLFFIFKRKNETEQVH